MKIALHNPFFKQAVAETELAKRINIAAENLGHEAIEFGMSSSIREYQPDFVLVMHHNTAKLTSYPTYGCMWNPKPFINNNEGSKTFLKNILSYDAFLCSSFEIKEWLNDYLYTTNKKYFLQDFFTSCYRTEYFQPNLDDIKLFYCGTNWDGPRYNELFLALGKTNTLEIFGPEKSWEYLQHGYQGKIPFNGRSILERLQQAGVGLCLHKKEHFDSNTPSMRIFEIIASGALAISDDMKFIKDTFGDTVFYIDYTLDVTEKIHAITDIMNWIKNNKIAACEKSKIAHEIFCSSFSLEVFLEELIDNHKQLLVEKYFLSSPSMNRASSLCVKDSNSVEIILRVGGRPIPMIERSLKSILNQTYLNTSVLIVEFDYIEGLDNLIDQYKNLLNIRKIYDAQNTPNRSSTLWTGLNNLSRDYFSILDDDDEIHPNHIATLMSIIESDKLTGVAYSGSVKILEDEGHTIEGEETDNSTLAYFNSFSINALWETGNFITSNSFIARTSLLDNIILKSPNLDVFEDYFLLLYFSQKAAFKFSYEATCNFYHRISMNDNSVYLNKVIWDTSMKRLKTMLWNINYPISSNIDKFSLNNWEEQLFKISAELESTKNRYVEIQDKYTEIQDKYTEIQDKYTEIQDKYTERLSTEINNMHDKFMECCEILTLSQREIEAMKSSKVWKLREIWFKIKSLIN